jgi:radical SAM superfamily enzyme YgiQ (UPF0313 family)
MKVVLISPKNSYLKDSGDRPPLGIAYLGAYLREKEFDVELVDMNHTSKIPDADFYGVSIVTPAYSEAIKIAKKLKGKGTLIASGPHPSAVPHIPYFDKIIRGEGERALYWICSGKYNRKIITAPLINNLDILPFPARDLLPMEKYSLKLDGEPATPIITSRGCPFNCIYCGKQLYGQIWRGNSAKYVVSEMRHIISKYGISNFYIYDDAFTLNKARIDKLCFLIKKKHLDVSFRCTSRVDCVTKSMLSKLKAVGCKKICYGVESGSSKILNTIQKGFTKQKVRQIVKTTKEVGIKTKLYFMLGLPSDTKRTMQQTINFCNELNPDEADFYILTPYPGSKLWTCPEKYDIKINYDKNWNNVQAGSSCGVNITHRKVNKDEILYYYNKAKQNWGNK